jgi:capsid assembly protease
MKAPLLHAASQIFDQCLMVLPERLDVILRYLAPRLDSQHQSAIDRMFSDHLLLNRTKGLPDGAMDILAFDDDYDLPQSQSQPKKPYSLTSGGVAVIPIRGTLLKKSDWMSAASGLTSYASITNAFTSALDDDSVKGILFDVDSPGGTTHGCFELADLIYSSRKLKPIYAACNDLMASAAYALGSSAEKIFQTRTGASGSVGVFMLHCDQEGADKQSGVKYTYIFAGDKKVDGNPHESLSRSAKRDCQTEVDRQYQMFVDCVARNRSASSAKIQDTEAGIYSATAAIPLLADSIGTFDDALAALTKRVSGPLTKTVSKTTSAHATIPTSLSAIVIKTTAEAKASAPGDDDMSVTLASLLASASPEELAQLAALASASKEDGKPEGKFEPKDKKMKSEPKDKDDNDEPKPDDDDDDEPEPDDKKKDKKSSKKADDYGDDMKKSKKAAKKDDEEDCEPGASKAALASLGTIAFAEATDAITDMCAVGNRPALAGHYIKQLAKGRSLSAIRASFQDARAKESADNPTDAAFTAPQVSANAIDDIMRQAKSYAQSNKVSESDAMLSVLRSNPALYQRFQDERAEAAMSPGATRQYVQQMSNRMRLLGLRGGDFGVSSTPGARL